MSAPAAAWRRRTFIDAREIPHVRRAVFFDRDGIVNERIVGGYVRSVSELVLIDAILDVLSLVHERGYRSVLVSNQQGVGKGLMTAEHLQEVTDHLQQELMRRCGVAFDDIRYCTDLDSAGSPRRKPAPGMLLEAAEEAGIDLPASWMIGDSVSDAEAGRAAGVRTILVGDHGTVAEADWIVPSVADVLPVLRAHLH
ncbi:MAG: D-glycero-alpha-D-manno-heptose-1,7-bisphosphate 7-phosphatase [Candidatus Kapaibacterium sp.]